MYASLGRKLVGLARIGPGMEVVDLACGTGAVTREILRVLDDSGSVVGVDASQAMLPDLDYPTRMAILERAYAGYDRDRVEVNRWMTFLCRPAEGGPG